jgi:hypothetical protein
MCCRICKKELCALDRLPDWRAFSSELKSFVNGLELLLMPAVAVVAALSDWLLDEAPVFVL